MKQRPTLTVPTVSLPGEVRTVSRPGQNDVLISAMIFDGHTDWRRMSAEVERDIVVYPSFSDGTETTVTLDDGDVVHFSRRDDGELGLHVREVNRYGDESRYTISGYARVTISTEITAYRTLPD